MLALPCIEHPDELRAQNPELYDLAFTAGVRAERCRVFDHLAMGDDDLCTLAVVRRAITSNGSLEDWLPAYERAEMVLAEAGSDPTKRVRRHSKARCT